MSINLQKIQKAAELIRGSVIKTPTLHSKTLSKITGSEVVIKFENLQFTSSFKDRGSLVKLLSLSESERKDGVIAVSAGNHAQGVAYHSQRLGIPSLIIMPQNTPYSKVNQTKNFGAKVILHGDNLSDCDPFAQETAKQEGLHLIHPYNDESIIAGQGTVALEMLEDDPLIETLIIPVGGGGLIAGCATAAKEINPNIEIIGAETSLYPSLYQALKGEVFHETGGSTIAEGIAVKSIGNIPLEINKKLVDDVIFVCEYNLERAIFLYLEVEKTIAEGAGAASLAALLCNEDRFKGKRVGIVLSGGNIDSRQLAQVISRGLLRSGRILILCVNITDTPGTLAKVSNIIGENGGNIIEVRHQRLFTNIPAKGAELNLILEVPDSTASKTIIYKLKDSGFEVNNLSADADTVNI